MVGVQTVYVHVVLLKATATDILQIRCSCYDHPRFRYSCCWKCCYCVVCYWYYNFFWTAIITAKELFDRYRICFPPLLSLSFSFAFFFLYARLQSSLETVLRLSFEQQAIVEVMNHDHFYYNIVIRLNTRITNTTRMLSVFLWWELLVRTTSYCYDAK